MSNMEKYVRHVKAGVFLIVAVIIFAINLDVYATQGCCSHHGGVSGCNNITGKQICSDGSDSPTCACEFKAPTNQQKGNGSPNFPNKSYQKDVTIIPSPTNLVNPNDSMGGWYAPVENGNVDTSKKKYINPGKDSPTGWVLVPSP